MNLNLKNLFKWLQHEIRILLYELRISYPYLDTEYEFGGLKPGTRVEHPEHGLGETMNFAQYHNPSKDYCQMVLFDKDRESGFMVSHFVRCKDLKPTDKPYRPRYLYYFRHKKGGYVRADPNGEPDFNAEPWVRI